MVVLGVDPGTRFAGYSIIKKQGNMIQMLEYGVLVLSPSKSLQDRISELHDFFLDKIVHFSVGVLALETPFLGKSPLTFLKLGYVRGILYLLASKYSLSLCEYAPTQIKQAVTGFGGASKEQVARVITTLFPKIKCSTRHDITDAIAISLCGSWSLKNNPI